MDGSRQMPRKKITSLTLKRKLKREIDDLRKQKAAEEERRRIEREKLQLEMEMSIKQKAAEEEKRKLQREILRQQAAALLEKQREKKQDTTPGKLMSISIPAPKSYSDIPQDSPFADRMRLAVDEQQRKEQREGLLRQATELLRKKESEGQPLLLSNKVHASSPARPLKAAVFESLLVEEQKRKEQQRRDSEIQDEVSEQASNHDEVQLPLYHSPSKPRSQSITPMRILNPETTKGLSERRKEQREVLRRQASELLTRNGGDTSFLMRSGDDQADQKSENFSFNTMQGGNDPVAVCRTLDLPARTLNFTLDSKFDKNISPSSHRNSPTNASYDNVSHPDFPVQKPAVTAPSFRFDGEVIGHNVETEDKFSLTVTAADSTNGKLKRQLSAGTKQQLMDADVNEYEENVGEREVQPIINASPSNSTDKLCEAPESRPQPSTASCLSPRNMLPSNVGASNLTDQNATIGRHTFSEGLSRSVFPFSSFYQTAVHTTGGLPPYYHGSYLTFPPYWPNYIHYPTLDPYSGVRCSYPPYPAESSYSNTESVAAVQFEAMEETFKSQSQRTTQKSDPAYTQKEIVDLGSESTKGFSHLESAPPIPSKKVKVMSSLAMKCFSFNPLCPPSPFALSHVVVNKPLIVVKRSGETFGITLSMIIESTLVPMDSNVAANGDVSNGNDGDLGSSINADVLNHDAVDNCDTNALSNTNTGASVKASNKRRRRRRVFFTAMTVVDPSVQNARKLATSDLVGDETSGMIQKGDILLSINGSATAGLTFTAACDLFAKCNTEGSDGIVRCHVEVARIRADLDSDKRQEDMKNDTCPVSSRGVDIVVFSHGDFVTLVTSVLKALLDVSRRFIGSSLSFDDVKHHADASSSSLTRVSASRLKLEWGKLADICKQDATSLADSFWKNNNAELFNANDLSSVARTIRESKLCLLRASPRPSDGSCRCGSQTHQYVNHPSCFLYSRLRCLETSDDGIDTTQHEKKKRKLTSGVGDLNTVEKAFTDSILRKKFESDAEEAEAKFVDKMEMIQIHRCNQAVFPPSLEAIVLSAVAEFSKTHRDDTFVANKLIVPMDAKALEVKQSVGYNSGDDDDDVPLALLGSKFSSGSGVYSTLKQQLEAKLSHQYLARLVRFISEKWGHVYYEPSHLEYAWRWEVFHGQMAFGTQKWIAGSKNQREVNSLSLENVRFLLGDEEISGFEQPDTSNSYLTAITVLAHVLSPQQTGICDELLALLCKDILIIDESRGILDLSEDWYSKVDVTILEDMQLNWGRSADPGGKFGIIEEIRKLCDSWDRTAEGWLLKEDNEIVFLFDELREWRKAFEHKHQVLSDGKDGIGRFY